MSGIWISDGYDLRHGRKDHVFCDIICRMNRREFIACASFAGAASAVATVGADERKPKECSAQLRLCLQWGAIPVADDFNAKLDYLEANGYSAVEIPTGKTGEWTL